MRLLPGSIRNRMVILSALTTLVAMIIAGLIIANTFERFVTQGIDQRLDAQITLLASSIDEKGQVDESRLAAIQGLLNAGRGWHWRIEAPGKTRGSGDFRLVDRPRDMPDPVRDHRPDEPRPGEGEDRTGRPVHARQATLTFAGGTVVISAVAPRAVIERPIRGAMLPLVILMLVLCGILAAASLLQIRYGLRPLRQLRDEVAAIRAGRARSASEDQPDELRPLAMELNALMRDNAAALATSRASAANLAHALKTPVAALALELGDNADLTRQIARIDATIRHHLSRARDRIVDKHEVSFLAPAAADLATTVERLHADSKIRIMIDIDPHLAVTVDAADLDEMLGNLIDNAMRYARATVIVSAEDAGRVVFLRVVDDGAGIPAGDRNRALAPGTRLDERGDGHGFGLSITREIAELYGGTLAITEATTGGASVCITLPKAVSGAQRRR